METLAFIHTAVGYEDPNPAPELRSFDQVSLKVPGSIMVGALAIGVATATLSHADSASALMRSGDSGPGVRQLQEQLGISADGVYGSFTQASVISFQRRNGLLVDGVAGPATLSALGLPAYLSSGSGNNSGGEVPVSGSAYVTAGIGLNIRNRPNGYVIGGLGYGQSVSLTGAREVAGGRSWVQLSSGGWVAENYLSIGGGNSGGEVPIGGGAYVTAGIGLNIRSRPDGAVIGGLGYGESVALTGAREFAGGRSWVQLSSGGWVAENYIGYR